MPVRVAADGEQFESELLTTLNAGVAAPEIPAASPAEVDYFHAVEAAVVRFSAAVDELFQAPLATEKEAIVDGGDGADLDPDEEATLREFFTSF